MRIGHLIGLCAAVACLLLYAACEKQEEAQRLIPSEANVQIFDSVMVLVRAGKISTEEEFCAARNRFASGIIGGVRSDSLQGEELFDYGKMLSWSGNEEGAKDVFDQLRREGGAVASRAWKELITFEIEAGRYAEAEASMREYRTAYPPDAGDLSYLYEQCLSLADRYSEADDPESAVRVRMDELRALPFDAPYNSYELMGYLTADMISIGRLEEARALVESCRNKFQAALGDREKAAQSDSVASGEDETAEGLQSMIRYLTSLSVQHALIGEKAPGFTFLHVYNADSTLSLEQYRGTAVMLDFWTNWCVGCVIGYVESRQLYDEYRGKGFEIIGITSLQGRCHNVDADSTEGGADQPLDKAREIELTGRYIQTHNMTWPIGISDRSAFDPAYSVTGVPTFVLIDREGIVRFIQTGAGNAMQKRRVLDRIVGG